MSTFLFLIFVSGAYAWGMADADPCVRPDSRIPSCEATRRAAYVAEVDVRALQPVYVYRRPEPSRAARLADWGGR